MESLTASMGSMKLAEKVVKVAMVADSYNAECLKAFFYQHKSHVQAIQKTVAEFKVKARLPIMPEHISENIVKYIIHNKVGDTTSRWDCAKGDLVSETEGRQECKCFTSDGPISFGPTEEWDVLYFLDARQWLDNHFLLYRVPLSYKDPRWTSVKVNKTQTFEDQSKQSRRPRIGWDGLLPQLGANATKVFEGSFEDIFA